MSTQTEFDKELEQIINHAIVRSNRNVAPLTVDNEAIKAIKAAVDKYVLPKVKHTLAEIQDLNENLDSTSQKHWYSYSEGYIKAVDEARLALWGDK